MLSYVGFVWNAKNTSVSLSAEHLIGEVCDSFANTTVFSSIGLTVIAAGEQAHGSRIQRIGTNGGVVLGTLFKRSEIQSSRPEDLLDEDEAREICASDGRLLVRDYWGRYVAFVLGASGTAVNVVRDPSAALPCEMTCIDGVHIYFSTIDTIIGIRRLKLSIDWSRIARELVLPEVEGRDTCLKEIKVVSGGECVRHHHDLLTRHWYWHPFQIANTEMFEHVSTAADAIRDSMLRSTQSWSALYERIAVRLSGGLDSSAVTGCLASTRNPRSITAIHYFNDAPGEDERVFARSVAARTGVELIEIRRNPHIDFRDFPSTRLSSNPCAALTSLETWRKDVSLCVEARAQAIFSGFGGDQLFYTYPAMCAPGDFLYLRRTVRGFLSAVMDVAYLERTSAWKVARLAVAQLLSQQRWSPVRQLSGHLRLLAPELVSTLISDDTILHPWFWNVDSSGIPAGKLWHIYFLTIPPGFYNPYQLAGDPAVVHPFMSQPVIEACLRSPTYLHTSGGWNRSMERRAFKQWLPDDIFRRVTKGGMNTHFKEIFYWNRQFIRDYLLSGVLVQRSLLDRSAVNRCFERGASGFVAETSEVVDYLSTEAWLRAWTSRINNRIRTAA